MGTVSSPCFVIFPFMSHGHTIPLLYLARLLRRRGISVAVFTTPANAPSIQSFLKDDDIKTTSIIELPFPNKPIDGVPPGVENTHHLPSISAFYEFANATALMQPDFEKALQALHPVGCIISDAFLGWTQETAAKLGVPRYFFFGMSAFATTVYQVLRLERPHAEASSPDEAFTFPDFPGLKLTRNDFQPPFNELHPSGPQVDFILQLGVTMVKSQGLIVNSLYELEARYLEYWNNNIGPKAWCIGPLCLACSKPPTSHISENQPWMQWLDHNSPVLYVAFGTQAEISAEQLKEIAEGLEGSGVKFLWVIRPKLMKHLEGFEERAKDRGVLVKDWVNQNEILMHKNVTGFLSHCGWNSVLESVSAKVPILALPFMADQHLNARLVAEEGGIGLRVMPRGGTVRGFVEAKEVEKMARELMEGLRGAEVRRRVEEVGEAAAEAMRNGGSSWLALGGLIQDAYEEGKEALSVVALTN